MNVGDGVDRVDVEAGKITDNEWHMLSATFDRDGLLKVYVDGVLKSSGIMANIGNINNSFPLTFGADGNGAYPFMGYISEVRIFKGLLNAMDIESWQCQVLNEAHPKFSNVLGHWKMTEGTGTEIADSAQNSKGLLTNGEWRNAKESTVTILGNYDHTPRTVDVVKTALMHLCIPIEEDWNLDGKSLLSSDCNNHKI